MKRRERGLTLLELLAAMAVAAILFSVGVPAYDGLRRRVDANGLGHRITASLMTARTLAVTRRVPVSVCPSEDGLRCRETTVWDRGWIVFVDRARTGQPKTPSDIVTVSAGTQGLGLRSTGGRTVLRYQADGRSPGSNVTLSLCALADHTAIARVIVNNVGRLRTEPGRGSCQ